MRIGSRLVVVLGLAAGIAAVPIAPDVPAASAATPTAGQSTYVPIDPVRLMDTREPADPLSGPLGSGVTKDLRVTGVAGVPANATAVVLNVTATGPTAATDIRVYPTRSSNAFPTVSNLNVVAGRTAANLVTVKVGDGGRVRLRNASGSVHLIADLSGYFVPSGSGASYRGANPPTRLLDTREGGGALGAGETRTLRVTGGTTGVADAATAVVLNVTAVGATEATDVRVYPTRLSGGPPTVSNLNPTPGRTTPAAVVVAVGDAGSVTLRNAAGSVHLVVDVMGAYLPGTEAAVFHSVDPVRLTDSRLTGRLLDGSGDLQDVVVAGAGVVPSQASAVVLNVTAVGATSPTDIRVFPSPAGESFPATSNLNVVPGEAVPNAVVATVGRDGLIRLRSAAGRVHFVIDLAGWYGPSGDGWDISWPQCASAGSSSTKPLPADGAFSVVGLTGGKPFTPNSCFAAEWRWASALPGEPAVYINTNAPGPGTGVDSAHWDDGGPRACSGSARDSGCGYNYGWNLAGYALSRMPTLPFGRGRPMVWLDVEGPYSSGPFWQTGYSGATTVNRAVIDGVRNRLTGARYRVGIYSDRATSSAPDWIAITGGYHLPTVQNWVFRAPTSDPAPLCTPASSFSGGPVVMVQVQPGQSGETFDVNHLC
ncbi:MAG TPA: hypothetical protein VNA30_05500 [Mycobacteriales bacterium]|nr:hypothetical protein [Mycobacteriales bacterium]